MIFFIFVWHILVSSGVEMVIDVRKNELSLDLFLGLATRWLPYIVGVVDGERGYLLHIQPVDVLLEQTKQGQVQRCQPGLLALKNK